MAWRCEERSRGHAERLIPMIEEIMDEAGLTLLDLAYLGVTVGPGSFMGIRTGVAAARGFALAIPAPVYPLSVFDVLSVAASNQSPSDERPILVAIDARRNQVYAQLFDGRAHPQSEPICVDIEAIASLSPAPGRLVGSGAGLVLSSLPDYAIVDIPLDARYLLAAVERRREDGMQPVRGYDVHPFYMRPPDANPLAGRSLLEVAAKR